MVKLVMDIEMTPTASGQMDGGSRARPANEGACAPGAGHAGHFKGDKRSKSPKGMPPGRFRSLIFAYFRLIRLFPLGGGGASQVQDFGFEIQSGGAKFSDTLPPPLKLWRTRKRELQTPRFEVQSWRRSCGDLANMGSKCGGFAAFVRLPSLFSLFVGFLRGGQGGKPKPAIITANPGGSGWGHYVSKMSRHASRSRIVTAD